MIDDLVCWKCGSSLDDIPRPLSRYQPCRRCGTDLYVCRMCLHLDPRSKACSEEGAEMPRSKETANFCDWFKPRANAFQAEATESQGAARDAVAALFGEGEARPAQGSPGEALRDLFSEKPKAKE